MARRLSTLACVPVVSELLVFVVSIAPRDGVVVVTDVCMFACLLLCLQTIPQTYHCSVLLHDLGDGLKPTSGRLALQRQ
jgi:hypothetical protein